MTSKKAAPNSYFDFLVIDHTPFLEESYALRYSVYCEEAGFLNEKDYPDKHETDGFDNCSVHVGAVDKSGLLVGTVRMVLPSERGFPFYQHCELFDEYKNLTRLDDPVTSNAVEISRLAVAKSYRRRRGDGLYGTSERTSERTPERRQRPELVLGLYKTIYQETKRRGISAWFAAMETTLLRLLHRYQFGFKPIGPEVDYYGPVTPYLAKIAELEKGVRDKYPDLYAAFIEGLEPEYLD